MDRRMMCRAGRTLPSKGKTGRRADREAALVPSCGRDRFVVGVGGQSGAT